MLLYKHNLETYQKMIELFHQHSRVAAVQPTGTGKSFLILQLIADNPEKHFLIASPSTYIFKQLRLHAEKHSVDMSNCSFITFAKLSQMSEEEFLVISSDYIVLDEFHRCGAAEWSKGVEKVLSIKPKSKVFGTSATPIRYLDSFRNMAEELFDGNYAVNMSLAEAIRRKILPLPVYVTSWYSFYGDIARLEKRAETSDNPYFRRILYGKIQKAKSMIADLDCGLEKIFARHMINKSGKYIVFCSSTERLQQVYDESLEWFSDVNENVHQYAVYSQNAASEKEYAGFCEDNDEKALKLLFSVNMLNEGVHVEGIDGVIMLRATQSANVFYQQLGRALSCASGKSPVIFDIVNNFETGDVAKQYSEIMEIGRQYGSGEEYDIQFELLKNFVEINHRPPNAKDKIDGCVIGQWYLKQKKLIETGQLAPELSDKIHKLNILEISSYDVYNDLVWRKNYEALKQFMDGFHRPPYTDEVYHGIKLYQWLIQQKNRCNEGKLKREYVDKFMEIGIDISVFTSGKELPRPAWMSTYMEYKKVS